MKRLLLTLVVMCAFCATYAGNGWQELKQQDGIIIKYKYKNCDPEYGFDQETLLLQITNTNATDKTIDWDLQLWYNNVCKTCNDPYGEYHRTITVRAGDTVEGVCSVVNGDHRLQIFSKFTDVNYTNSNVEELTQFELANFTVSQ